MTTSTEKTMKAAVMSDIVDFASQLFPPDPTNPVSGTNFQLVVTGHSVHRNPKATLTLLPAMKTTIEFELRIVAFDASTNDPRTFTVTTLLTPDQVKAAVDGVWVSADVNVGMDRRIRKQAEPVGNAVITSPTQA